MNWFLPSEASLKRTLIQRLIFELLENRPREGSSAAALSDEDPCSKFPKSNKNEVGVQFFSERCSPGLSRPEDLSCSGAGQGIEITLLSGSSMRSTEGVNDSGLVLRELFEPGATSGSLLEHYQTFDQKSSYYHLNGALSPGEVLTFFFVLLRAYISRKGKLNVNPAVSYNLPHVLKKQLKSSSI